MTPNGSNLYWDDEGFQDALVQLLCRDAKSLQDCGALLSADDFKPLRGMRRGRQRWVVAKVALDHWRRHHEPLGRLLTAGVLEHAAKLGFLGGERVEELKEYCAWVQEAPVSAPDGVVEKAVRFKHQVAMAAAVQELTTLQASGQLDDAKWQEVTRRAMASSNGSTDTVDYTATLSDRLERRRTERMRQKHPWTYIDPLDSIIQPIGFGEFGMAIAPPKGGKTMLLHWLSVAYVLQRLNSLIITLETPKTVVEDRLDSIATSIPVKLLHDHPGETARRFERFRAMIKRQLHIFDGTQGGVTVQRIEQIINAERNRGFLVDALIIDYDDEITPVVKHKERRYEFADIYRDLRQLTARYKTITWTAARSKRDTENLKIISGSHISEDISKVSKVNLAISIGKGDWEDGKSIYLYVANANNDEQHMGCHIIPDRKRCLIFDREATQRAARRYKNQP